MSDRDDALRHLVAVYPSWRRRSRLPVDSCIAATHIGIEVLRYFGWYAQPMPVAVQVHNARLVELRESGVEVPIEDYEKLGAWSLGTDPDKPPSKPAGLGWNGHLVIWLPSIKQVVDLSLEQYSRPHVNIELGSAAFSVHPNVLSEFVDGGEWITVKRPDGSRVLYQHRPELTTFKQTSNWKRGRYRSEIASLIRGIKASIAEEQSEATSA